MLMAFYLGSVLTSADSRILQDFFPDYYSSKMTELAEGFLKIGKAVYSIFEFAVKKHKF